MNQNDRTQSNWIALKNLDQFKMEHIGAGFHCNALLTLKFTEQTFLFPIYILVVATIILSNREETIFNATRHGFKQLVALINCESRI